MKLQYLSIAIWHFRIIVNGILSENKDDAALNYSDLLPYFQSLILKTTQQLSTSYKRIQITTKSNETYTLAINC